MTESQWKHVVEWGECDPAGIVFYPNFYRWFDSSSHHMMKIHGFGQKEMISLYGIVGFPLIEAHAKFLRPLRWEDQVTVHSFIQQHSRRTFTIRHKIYKWTDTEELCVDGYEVRIWGIKDKETGVLNASNLPDEFIQHLAKSSN